VHIPVRTLHDNLATAGCSSASSVAARGEASASAESDADRPGREADRPRILDLNGVYLASLFAAGAAGSAAGAWAYARDGWTLACVVAVAPPLVALARFLLCAASERD